ncbi:putative phospholipid-binding protein [Phialemonium atrogriseum]|uniref:Phospholipid-binding protein n=1 Tax=Phialemonium atrogriseum TaxID=1093897 RepID=A0AAJ0FQ53_9PEZI|nr:putative phospholipid-binding protein [Phialemonium atrogriseum]KAK1768810.1 putative phospholipid-binding protein [Phialemonium atrogriseum]
MANPPPSPTPSQLPPVPTSPTYSYASTANPLSQYNLPLPPPPRPAHAVLTKADLEHSQAAYGDLLTSAKAYRLALAALSSAASAFGSALESCARLKEARADAISPPAAAANAMMMTGMSNSFNAKGTCTADGLLAASGLQHLVANHQQILSEAVYRAFEVPLLHELDKWRAAVDDEQEAYGRAVRAQSRDIRRMEKEGMKMHRQQRRRDVAAFREHLVQLTGRLDGLTALHAGHARTLLRESQDTSARILDASCSLVRAEVDIFEGLARKGWTGGGLEDLLEKGVDLFAADDAGGGHDGAGGGGGAGTGPGGGEGGGGGKLFSILPPKSILADSSTAAGAASSPASDSTARYAVADNHDDPYQSLVGAVSVTGPSPGPARGREAASFDPNRPRGGGVRPFSPPPQPVRLNPDTLIVGSPDKTETEERADNQNGDDDGDGDDGEPSAAKAAGSREPDLGSMSLTLESVAGREVETEDEDEEDERGAEGEEKEESQDQPWLEEGLGGSKDGDTPSASLESSQQPNRKWSFGGGRW